MTNISVPNLLPCPCGAACDREEGAIRDVLYPSARYSGYWSPVSAEGLSIKRAAIDAALLATSQVEA